MVLGEKIWEGKAKTLGTAIRAVGADGVTLEYTWTGQLKGAGRAKGADAGLTFTGTVLMGPTGAGPSHGQGILNAMTGDMVIIKGSGYGWNEAGKGKGGGIWSFMAMSPKLNWINNVVAIITQEGDPQWMEFDVAIHEWK